MKAKSLIQYAWGDPRIRWTGLSVLWLVLLFLVAIPSWRAVVEKNQAIGALEKQLATLDDWTVAGLWLAPSVQERSLPVNATFSRLFPAERQREQLFLSLARVADESGVEDFGLSEIVDLMLTENDVWSDGTTMAATVEDEPPTDGSAAVQNAEPVMSLEVPSVDLASYRVTTHFSGDYSRAARFLGGLINIERAVKVHSLVVRPEKDGIQVDMELDIYVSQINQS